MTDRPILFSAPMIKALLAGTKHQTRRLIKVEAERPIMEFVKVGTAKDTGRAIYEMKDKAGQHVAIAAGKHFITENYSPPIAVGDRLWVKETHAIVPRTAYRMSEGVQQTICPNDPDDAAVYAAGWERSRPGQWKPSIHMPRWASRITLLVDDVKVERLQDISEDDAIAEGVVDMGRRDGEPYSHCHIPGVPSIRMEHDAVPVYSQLWELINGPGSWARNPWIYAVRFRIVLENIDYIGRAAA